MSPTTNIDVTFKHKRTACSTKKEEPAYAGIPK
jgi:hypothetical protein